MWNASTRMHTAKLATEELRGKLAGRIPLLTEAYEEADYGILMLHPSSGEYFNATPGYVVLELCEE